MPYQTPCLQLNIADFDNWHWTLTGWHWSWRWMADCSGPDGSLLQARQLHHPSKMLNSFARYHHALFANSWLISTSACLMQKCNGIFYQTEWQFDSECCPSLTLKRPRLADWHEFARLTQGNSLASVLPSAFWAQDSGFNHSDDMQGSGQTCTTHKHQQEVSEKANNKQ